MMESKWKRDGFVFYRSFFESILNAPTKEDGYDLFMAICEFGLNGIEPSDDKKLIQWVFPSIKVQIERNQKNYENGCKGGEYGGRGGRPRNNETPNKPRENPEQTPNEEEEEYESEEYNESVYGNEDGCGFVPPTLKEINTYIKEHNCNIRGETFYNYYSAIGWKVGKNNHQLVDWKAMIQTWEDREQNNKPKRKGDYSQRNYSMEEYESVEAQLLKRGDSS